MKRGFLWFAGLVLALVLMTSSAYAADIIDTGYCGPNARWTLDVNGVLTVSGYGKADFSASIPYQTKEIIVEEGITYLYVNMAGAITKLTLPSTLTELDGPIREPMNNLVEVTCPDQLVLTGLEEGLFDGSPWSVKQYKENGLCILGKTVVDGKLCEGDVVIPEGIESIADYAFREGKLRSISLPSTLRIIGLRTFFECGALEEVYAPDDIALEALGQEAFFAIPWFQRFVAESRPIVLGSMLIKGMGASGDIVIPDGVKRIARDAFDSHMITSVAFPDSLEEIGLNAFGHCTELAHITLANNIRYIGDGAFAGCTVLQDISCPEDYCPDYIGWNSFSETAWADALGSKQAGILGGYLFGGYNLRGDYTVPEGVKRIGTNAFYQSGVKSVVVSDGVEQLDSKAFSSTYSLKTVRLSSTLTDIREGAFDTSYSFGDQLVFRDDSFKTIEVDEGNPKFSSANGFLCDKDGTAVVKGVYDPLTEYVATLYQNFLGRIPDMGGLSAWVLAVSQEKISGQKLVLNFVLSEEFSSQPLSDEEFITALYRTIFGREPDSAGLAAWLSVLDRGCTIGKVLTGFLNSAEMERLCKSLGMLSEESISLDIRDLFSQVTFFVSRMYQYCLGRKYDEEGLVNWVTALVEGDATGAQVANGFFFSKEMKNQGLDNRAFVTVAYRTILDRDPDADGLAAWVRALDEGKTREDIIRGFVRSAEFKMLCDEYEIIPV